MVKTVGKFLFLVLSFSYAFAGTVDTTQSSLQNFFKRGKMSGHMRNYFMATNNYGPLTDYYSLAVGAGIGYQMPEFKGFSTGFSGFFLFNVWSNDLGSIDTLGKGRSRYELGNFDFQDPGNRNNLERLESLFLKYRYRKTSLTIGRQNLLTPFINPQDGRMRPSLQDAFWLDVQELKWLEFRAGYIYGMSPRSTVNWFTVGKSIGVYPVGKGVDGNPSGYRNWVESKYVFLGNLQIKPFNSLKINYWFYHVDNVFNLHFVQTDLNYPFSSDRASVIAGLQYGIQSSSGNGGNSNQAKAYLLPGHSSGFISSRLGMRWLNKTFSLNYTHIFDRDRFLFPREWGIEPFYTFMARERNEGSANTHAFTFRSEYQLNNTLRTGAAFGYFLMPDVLNFRQNKNGMPSFNQLNLFLNYSFKGYLNGLNLQALYVYKGLAGETYNDLQYVFNRVMMSNYNLIVNYSL
ncbi:MAG: OprD family outer membrane porin [Thermaurantimonas aggregans]|nr:OprD family outer membrane porin [Thermaurantimonas aggregans]MCX8147996.1 OprD family outer membrane porin [Thermaurantimonas aggregans]